MHHYASPMFCSSKKNEMEMMQHILGLKITVHCLWSQVYLWIALNSSFKYRKQRSQSIIKDKNDRDPNTGSYFLCSDNPSCYCDGYQKWSGVYLSWGHCPFSSQMLNAEQWGVGVGVWGRGTQQHRNFQTAHNDTADSNKSTEPFSSSTGNFVSHRWELRE